MDILANKKNIFDTKVSSKKKFEILPNQESMVDDHEVSDKVASLRSYNPNNNRDHSVFPEIESGPSPAYGTP